MEGCKICNSKWYEEKIEVRTTSADDNVCEKIKQGNCEDCNGCSEKNNIFTMTIIDNGKIQLEYMHKIGGLTINPISECRSMKYCFECGRKL